MESFLPSEFFDLTHFAHTALFNPSEPVWSVLHKIGAYLADCSLGHIQGDVSEKAYMIRPQDISIGRGTVVEPGAYIQGPCIIGENCQIRHGAYIRGNVITGNGCVIGHATEVKNSIFLNGAAAGHFAYVGDSILGNKVNLGAGTKLANLRFDNGPIYINWRGARVETGLRKLGAILGDYVKTGCNSVTNPGTLMGKSSCLAPCCTASGVIETFEGNAK